MFRVVCIVNMSENVHYINNKLKLINLHYLVMNICPQKKISITLKNLRKKADVRVPEERGVSLNPVWSREHQNSEHEG